MFIFVVVFSAWWDVNTLKLRSLLFEWNKSFIFITLSYLIEKNRSRDSHISRGKPEDCPLKGQCLKRNLVYKAEIETTGGDNKIYIGTTGSDFKERYRNHKTSLTNEKKSKSTELSKHYWKLKKEGKTPTIKWSIVTEIRSKYSLKNGCTLCNTERYSIAYADKRKLLNKRNERKRVCPHYTSSFF